MSNPSSRTNGATGPVPWLAKAMLAQTEQGLYELLSSLRDARPRVQQPLLVDAATLRLLSEAPSPELSRCLSYCLQQLLLELAPGDEWATLQLTPATWVVALAVHNLLTPPIGDPETVDPVVTHTTALVAMVPPARTVAENLASHCLLRCAADELDALPPGRAALLHLLLARCPLTQVSHLHLHTPAPLTNLAAELLPGWRRRVQDPAPWSDAADWLATVSRLLAVPALARMLRHCWLGMPESRSACRNLGLLLEAMRRQGERDLLLQYYEAYEYLRAEIVDEPWAGPCRRWPILATAETLLRAEGDSEASLCLNRWGNEYLLKLLPLVWIVIEQQGVPKEYRHLSTALVTAVRPLLELVTTSAGPGLDLAAIEYVAQEHG